MIHNALNPNCDKNQYGDAPDVRCTCDVDSPEDVPVPSTVVGAAVMQAYPARSGTEPVVMLTGRRAELHAELERTTRDLDAARKLLAPAEAAWRKAMDAYMEALIGG